MATVSGHNDRLPVLAHRHRSKAMNTAVRARRQQESTKEVEYIQQRDIRPDLPGTDSPVTTPEDNTQPTPSSRRPKPQMRQRACRLRPDAQSQSTEKSPEKLLASADGEKDVQTLPGINQADPGKISNPMPGKNQPQPSIDAAAAALLFPDGRPSTVCKTMTMYLTMTRTRADADTAPTASSSGMNTGFSWPTPTTSRVSSVTSSTPSVAPIQSFSTFVLFSRSEDIKEQVTSTSSFQSINTPLALTTSSTLTALFVPTARPTPSNIASSAVGGSSSGLSPLSRSLFVLFGVLGAITMLIAVAVFYAARRNRKQQEQAERYIEDVPFESTKAAAAAIVYDYGSKPRMSADNTMHGLPPFLTESERNIVRRAATQDGQPEVHITAPGARLHDAINSFIAKSRRLTYKISP